MALNLSQLPIEILRGDQPAPDLRLSQLPIEVLRGPAAPAPTVYISQLPLEVLRGPSTDIGLVVIGGTNRTERTRYAAGIRIEYHFGARAVANFQTFDTDSTVTAYRPVLDQSVRITVDDVRLFSGSIAGIHDLPILPPHVGTATNVDAADQWRAAGQRVITESYADGLTLYAVVSDIVTTYLSSAVFGITLDPTMPAGPALPALTFDQITVEAAFNRLAAATSWMYRLTPLGVIEWFAIGTRLLAADVLCREQQHYRPGAAGEIRPGGRLVNRVILSYGPAARIRKRQDWTGDGSTTAFSLPYPVVPMLDASSGGIGISSRGVVNEDAIDYAMAISGWTSGMTWYVRRRDACAIRRGPCRRWRRRFGSSIASQFPADHRSRRMSIRIAVHGPWEDFIEELPDITDVEEATVQAEAALRRLSAMPRTVSSACASSRDPLFYQVTGER